MQVRKTRKMRYKVKRIYSPWKKKMLLLLLGGFTAGMTGSTKKVMNFWTSIPREFKQIDREYLRKLIKEFYHDRLVDIVDISDEESRIVLTEKGKLQAIQFKIDDMQLNTPQHWDQKWRLIIFDVPEKKRAARDTLRSKLKELGLYELQKSAFIYPFNCKDEMDFITELFQIRPYIRYAVVESISNEAELKQHFDLI